MTPEQASITDEELAATVEVFRKALMVAHADDWTMEVVAEAAHICARALADSPLIAALRASRERESDLRIALQTLIDTHRIKSPHSRDAMAAEAILARTKPA